MQRFSQRLFATVLVVLGVGGIASAQSPAPNPYPVIPVAPVASQPQSIPYQGSLAGTYPRSQAQSIPQQMPSLQQLQQVQALPQFQGTFPLFQQGAQPAVPPAISTGTPTPVPNPQTGQFGSYGTPPQSKYTAVGPVMAPVPYNEYCPQCANGCGSPKSDLGFIFGSCKSFFNPCGPIPCNAGGCKKCGTIPYGQPYGHGFNTCAYDSYANH